MNDLLSIEEIRELRNKKPDFAPKLEGIYFLFQDDEIVYIGKTECLFRRLGEHMRKKTFNDFSFLRVSVNLEKIEHRYIKKYLPTQGNSHASWAWAEDENNEINSRLRDIKIMNKAVRKWAARLAKLRIRDNVKESEFCRKHGFAPAWLNKLKNGVQVPSQEAFRKIEDALASEGV